MFFIVPKNTTSFQSSTVTTPSSLAASASKGKKVAIDPEEVASYYPKRITKACDRCRLKKARCSGGQLCKRCERDGVVCVTSRNSKRPALPQNPRYVHLVESQRDQLVQALCQILHSKDTPDSSKLKEILANMGIATESLQVPQPYSALASSEAPRISDKPPLKSWSDMVNDLNSNQLQLIESFCATTPQTQDTFVEPYPEIDYQNSSLQELNSQGPFQGSEPGHFADLCSWSKDVTMPDHYEAWEVKEDMSGANASSTLPFAGSVQPNMYHSRGVL